MMMLDQQRLSAAEKAAMDAGVKFGMDMLKQLPRGDLDAMEAHMTGVLIVFWGALWGTFGTEYAGAFIRAQLRGMDAGVPHDRFTEPRVQ